MRTTIVGTQAIATTRAGSAMQWGAWLALVALTLAYPFLLAAFGRAADHAGDPGAASGLSLCAAISVPLLGLGCAHWLGRGPETSGLRAGARRFAFTAIVAPPLFTLIGVARGLAGHPLTDESVWLGLWLLAIGAAFLPAIAGRPRPGSAAPGVRWRVAHGIGAAFLVVFIAFHLGNHLAGLIGPTLHAEVMAAGRKVYRLVPVEIVLVGLLLLQVTGGLVLAARWSRRPCDGFRVLQVGSGLYLAAFVVTHLNSALVSARAVRHIDTNWAWATGGAQGLLHDAWNIRLVPHYGYGVFFVLAHLLLGLRQVLIAHGVGPRLADRLWAGGMVGATAGAAAIMAGLLGMRLP